ncbi:hypothetical protein EC991_009626 [Linnemannia zychae]|nr:hypothetical protein EC991_009626 [Linnemannia zychae]
MDVNLATSQLESTHLTSSIPKTTPPPLTSNPLHDSHYSHVSTESHIPHRTTIARTGTTLVPLILTLPEILVQIFSYLTEHQQRRLVGHVCHQWRTIVQLRYLSVSDKAFPVNVMDEGGSDGWGNEWVSVLAAPRIVEWELATPASGSGTEGEGAEQGPVTSTTVPRDSSSKRDLRTLLKESGRQILKFRRTAEDLSNINRHRYSTQAAYYEIDSTLLYCHWQTALKPLQKPLSSEEEEEEEDTVHAKKWEYLIKELRFESNCIKDWDVIPQLARALCIGWTVKILRIEPTYYWDLLHLLPLMDAFPVLEELYIKPHRWSERRWSLAPPSHFFSQDQEDQMTGSVAGVPSWLMTPQQHLKPMAETRIRVLVLFGTAMTFPAMEAVTRRCPRIEVLKFIQSVDYCRDDDAIIPVDRSAFWPYFRTWCKQIRELHFSRYDRRVQETELDSLRLTLLPPNPYHTDTAAVRVGDEQGYTPNQTGFSYPHDLRILGVSNNELTPFVNYLGSFQTEWLTGLRFERIRTGTVINNQSSIHKILCSCPNLMVFTAQSVYYNIEDMDVNNLLGIGGRYREESEPPLRSKASPSRSYGIPNWPEEQEPLPPRTVWACRNLRTLHIAISALNKSSPNHVSSLVMFGYLSLVCPRLEELIVKREHLLQDDESGLCLLGRLKYLKRLQTHATAWSKYPDVAWLRRRTLENGGEYANGRSRLSSVHEQQDWILSETLLERLVKGSRSKWKEGHPITRPSAYMRNLPPLPDFQVERKPFLTADGVDLSGVGRPDDLISWILKTNRDIIQDPDSLGLQGYNMDREEGYLPRLDLLYLYQSNDEWAVITRPFMRSQRPEIDFRADDINYYG